MKEILKTMMIFILLIAILGTLIYICQENVNPNISYAASSNTSDIQLMARADGQINQPIDSNSTVYKAARDAMNGWDPTGGCIYYFNPNTATNKWIWSRPLVKVIGKHRFCK